MKDISQNISDEQFDDGLKKRVLIKELNLKQQPNQKSKNEKTWDKFWDELFNTHWGEFANPCYPDRQTRKIMNRYLIKEKAKKITNNKTV